MALKGLGKFVKKNVRFKNVVNLAKKYVPGVGGAVIGGLSDAHEAKKQARAEQNELKRQEHLERARIASENAGNSFGDAVASNASVFIKSAGQKAWDNSSDSFKSGTSTLTMNVAKYKVTEFWNQHKMKVIIVVILGVVYYFYKKQNKPRRR